MDDVQTVENDVAIADVGPSRKKLSITIPPEAIEQKLAETFDTLAHDTALPGFRKGRVPRALIERRFGDAVLGEARNQLIAQAYSEAVQANNLKVLGDPTSSMDEAVVIEKGKPLSFELEVEVMPEFELPEMENIAVDKPVIEVTDEMVGEETEKIRINEGRLDSLERPEKGDYVTGHAIMRDKAGTEHYNIEGAVIQIPKDGDRGMILGLIVEDLGKQVGLPKPGETFTVTTTGPAQHEIEGVRNAELTITFRVDRADRIVPTETSELVQRFGLESEEQFTEILRARMEQRVRVEQVSIMHRQIAEYMLKNTEMTLPERLTAGQAQRVLDRKRMEFMHQGMHPGEVEERIAELRAGSAAAAGQELKLFFVLNALAEKLGISVSEGEVNGRISQLAASRQVRPEQLRQELIKSNRVGTVVQQIREHKTMSAVLENATITEMPLDEFNAKHAGQPGKAKG